MSTTATSPATSTLSTPSNREIHIERIFNAPRERVWQAMSDPKLLAQWWGRGNRIDIERYEFERGGHWRFVEHHAGGSDGFEGRFGDINPIDCMSQTFEWDGMPGHVSLNTAEFVDLGDGRTKLITTSLFMTPEDRDGMMQSGMKEGLDQSYAALDRLLETLE